MNQISMSMNKIYHQTSQSQHKSKKENLPNLAYHYRFIQLVKKCTPSQQAVLSYILSAVGNFKVLHPSQIRIACMVGVSREWVNKCLRALSDLGLITKENRWGKHPYQLTCIYKVSSLFFGPLRELLIPYLPALGKLLAVSLLSHPPDIRSESSQFTVLIYKYNTFSPEASVRRGLVRECLSPLPASFYFSKASSVLEDIQQKETINVERGMQISPSKINSGGCFHKKKEKEMSQEFSPTLEQIAEIFDLTPFGKIALAAFDEEILYKAASDLWRKPAVIAYPGKWLFKVCSELSQKKQRAPDWEKYKQLAIKYDVPTDGTAIYQRKSFDGTQNIGKVFPLMHVSRGNTNKGKASGFSTSRSSYGGQSARPPAWKPEVREERDTISEWINVENFRQTEQCRANERALGFMLGNSWDQRLADTLKSDPGKRAQFMQDYPQYWPRVESELLCPKSMSFLENQLPSNESDLRKTASTILKGIFVTHGK